MTTAKRIPRTKVMVAIVQPWDYVRHGMEDCLRAAAGCEVVFSSGDLAAFMAACRKGQQADIVFLELELPDNGAYVLLAWLHTERPALRVVGLAHKPTNDMVQRACKQGACTVMCTCQSDADLCTCVRDVSTTGAYHSPALRHYLAVGGHLRDPQGAMKGKEVATKEPTASELVYGKCYCAMKDPTIPKVAAKLGWNFYTTRAFHRTLCKKLNVQSGKDLLRVGLSLGWGRTG